MTAEIINLKPAHQVVKDSREGILTALSMVRSGFINTHAMDFILSKISDDLYDYVETLEGR